MVFFRCLKRQPKYKSSISCICSDGSQRHSKSLQPIVVRYWSTLVTYNFSWGNYYCFCLFFIECPWYINYQEIEQMLKQIKLFDALHRASVCELCQIV